MVSEVCICYWNSQCSQTVCFNRILVSVKASFEVSWLQNFQVDKCKWELTSLCVNSFVAFIFSEQIPYQRCCLLNQKGLSGRSNDAETHNAWEHFNLYIIGLNSYLKLLLFESSLLDNSMQSEVAGASVLETLWSARLIFSYFHKGMLIGHCGKGVLLLTMLLLVYKLNFTTFWSGTCFDHLLVFLVNELKMEWQGEQCSVFMKHHMYLLLQHHIAGFDTCCIFLNCSLKLLCSNCLVLLHIIPILKKQGESGMKSSA